MPLHVYKSKATFYCQSCFTRYSDTDKSGLSRHSSGKKVSHVAWRVLGLNGMAPRILVLLTEMPDLVARERKKESLTDSSEGTAVFIGKLF